MALNDFIGTNNDINFFALMTSRLTGSCQDDLGDECKFTEAGVSWKCVAKVAHTHDAKVAGGGGTDGGGAGGGPGHMVPEPTSAWLAGLAQAGLAAHRLPRRLPQNI